jgi:hypothetical protein
VLKGGFDRQDRFFFILLGANAGLTELWRLRVIALFIDKGLLNPDFDPEDPGISGSPGEN